MPFLATPSLTMPRTKTSRDRIAKAKPAQIVTLEKPFAGVPAGQRLFIPSPQVIADYLAAVPAGQTRTPEAMRADLARTAGADAACPVATAYSLRMIAEAALEDLRAGKDSAAAAPFWRVVAPASPLAAKLSCDAAEIAHRRAAETTG